MPISRLVVHGYGSLRAEISRWTSTSAQGKRLVLLFLSDHVDGKGWCPDCVTAEPMVEEALKSSEVTSVAGNVTVVTVFVGLRDPWKDKTNAFRTSEDLLVSSIPTLLEYGNLEHRLGDNECTSVETIKKFIVG